MFCNFFSDQSGAMGCADTTITDSLSINQFGNDDMKSEITENFFS